MSKVLFKKGDFVKPVAGRVSSLDFTLKNIELAEVVEVIPAGYEYYSDRPALKLKIVNGYTVRRGDWQKKKINGALKIKVYQDAFEKTERGDSYTLIF